MPALAHQLPWPVGLQPAAPAWHALPAVHAALGCWPALSLNVRAAAGFQQAQLGFGLAETAGW